MTRLTVALAKFVSVFRSGGGEARLSPIQSAAWENKLFNPCTTAQRKATSFSKDRRLGWSPSDCSATDCAMSTNPRIAIPRKTSLIAYYTRNVEPRLPPDSTLHRSGSRHTHTSKSHGRNKVIQVAQKFVPLRCHHVTLPCPIRYLLVPKPRLRTGKPTLYRDSRALPCAADIETGPKITRLLHALSRLGCQHRIRSFQNGTYRTMTPSSSTCAGPDV